jgi:predicted ATP-dependent serine protease
MKLTKITRYSHLLVRTAVTQSGKWLGKCPECGEIGISLSRGAGAYCQNEEPARNGFKQREKSAAVALR